MSAPAMKVRPPQTIRIALTAESAERLLDAVVQPLAHVLAERVDGRVVDGEHGHAAAAVEIDGLGDGCHGCFLSIRRIGLQTPGW